LIRQFLSDQIPEAKVTEAIDVEEAKAALAQEKPDLIFLDIQLGSQTGFDLLDDLGDVSAQVIFVTAYTEYAIKAFRYSAADYLVKPLDAETFHAAVNKAISRISQQPGKNTIGFLKEHVKGNHTVQGKLVIPTVEGFEVVSISDIIYCKALGNYTEIFLPAVKFTSSYTLGHFQDLLPQHDFLRIHRSYLININQVRSYKKAEGGSIIMHNGAELELAKSHREHFLQLFKG
jgi:two-component system LytT family response regulator